MLCFDDWRCSAVCAVDMQREFAGVWIAHQLEFIELTVARRGVFERTVRMFFDRGGGAGGEGEGEEEEDGEMVVHVELVGLL